MSAAKETGERILAAAAELFGERGYAATTTKAIAETAGVNEVTLFRRFGSKRGVLQALGESWQARMAGFVVDELPEGDDTEGTLETLARIEVGQATAAGPVAMRLALDARTTPEVAELLANGPGDNFAGLASYLAERQAAGDLRADLDPQVMAEAFFALTSGAVLSRQVLNGVSEPPYGTDAQKAAAQLLEVFLRGVTRGCE
ncbi:MAG: TetR/AcrR family transcriptional regulator [Actinobacteria bacterium]|nr:MAG: TetR/AcrR family transcriptional regulator [Actinomycetota bacterium]